MAGELRGDFARVTFDPLRHFTQVFQNQGRVQLEADWNEQGAILLHLLRQLAIDIKGRSWRAGPTDFALSWQGTDLTIGPGHFYVDGLLCGNETETTYAKQPWGPTPSGDPAPDPANAGFFYLDAWERHVSSNEYPLMREVALGGRESTSRAQLVWQIRTYDGDSIKARLELVDAALSKRLAFAQEQQDNDLIQQITAFRTDVANLKAVNVDPISAADAQRILDVAGHAPPLMRARAKHASAHDDPCAIAPDASYRGLENQLYRVEVQNSGIAGENGATIKVSRENGSVMFPILDIAADGQHTTLTTANLGPDARLGLCAGDWVEYVDDDILLARRAQPLLRVLAVDRGDLTVSVDGQIPVLDPSKPWKHPLLRRWDQPGDVPKNGLITLTEGSGDTGWIPIEDGIEVQFEPGGFYVTGDFWLIPARVATGDIEWPAEEGSPPDVRLPNACPPNGVAHHLTALGLMKRQPAAAGVTKVPITMWS